MKDRFKGQKQNGVVVLAGDRPLAERLDAQFPTHWTGDDKTAVLIALTYGYYTRQRPDTIESKQGFLNMIAAVLERMPCTDGSVVL